MPRKFVKYLEGKNIYSCKKCGCHLTSLAQLISKAFNGETGQAYLFNNVINVKVLEPKTQQLSTGIHVIASITCSVCDDQKPIGWKYISAQEQSQKYKESKFILEKYYLHKQAWIGN